MEQEQAVVTVAEFIKAKNITMTTQRIARRSDSITAWDKNARHWRCIIRVGNGPSMTVEYSQGSAIKKDPTVEDLLDCLASDAAGSQDAQGGFEDWCNCYGYDTDSRKAEKIYLQIQDQANKLERLLGLDDYQRLLGHTERL